MSSSTNLDVLRAVGVVTFAAAFVAQFCAQGVTLFLREAGAPSHVLSFLFLAGVPYTLRFLWAPLIDGTNLGGKARFNRWISLSQLGVGAVLFGAAFLSPSDNAVAIIGCVAVLMLLLGTIQTAIGGIMIEGLSEPAYPKGASIQAATSAFSGFALGLGVLYLIAPIGWSSVIVALVAICGLAVGATQLSLRRLPAQTSSGALPPKWWGQFSVFAQSNARRLLGFSVSISVALLVPFALKSVLLIDAGFDVATAGLIGIVFGNSAGFVGAVAARPLIERFGGRAVLAILGLTNGLVVLAVALLAINGLPTWCIVAVILYANFGVYAGYTASRSLLMPMCREGKQATELAGFVGLEAILFLILAGATVSLLDIVGLTPLLLVAGGISLFTGCTAVITRLVRRRGRTCSQ